MLTVNVIIYFFIKLIIWKIIDISQYVYHLMISDFIILYIYLN